MDIQTIQLTTQPVFRKYNIKKAAIIGSHARQDALQDSDVDILVELPNTTSFYDFINLKIDLEKELKKTVDLVEYEAIRPRLKPYIMDDEKIIYTER